MHRRDVNRLPSSHTYWIPAVVSPERDWAGAPGCRRGARFMVDPRTCGASRDEFDAFDSKLRCTHWIVSHREQLRRRLPGAEVYPVRLDRWLLGLE